MAVKTVHIRKMWFSNENQKVSMYNLIAENWNLVVEPIIKRWEPNPSTQYYLNLNFSTDTSKSYQIQVIYETDMGDITNSSDELKVLIDVPLKKCIATITDTKNVHESDKLSFINLMSNMEAFIEFANIQVIKYKDELNKSNYGFKVLFPIERESTIIPPGKFWSEDTQLKSSDLPWSLDFNGEEPPDDFVLASNIAVSTTDNENVVKPMLPPIFANVDSVFWYTPSFVNHYINKEVIGNRINKGVIVDFVTSPKLQ